VREAVVIRGHTAPAVKSWNKAWLLVAARSVVVFAAYYAAGRLGMALHFNGTNISPVWPPSGIAVGALLVIGMRYWPVLLGAAFLSEVTGGLPPTVAGALAAGNTLEYVLAAAFLRRAHLDMRLHSVRDIAMLGVAAAFAPMIAATIGVASLVGGGIIAASSAHKIWTIYLIGDCVGILTFAPPILVWLRNKWSFTLSRREVFEALALGACAVGVTSVVFLGGVTAAYLMFPLAIWAAVRFGQPGTTLTVLVINAIAIWGTVHGTSPFSELIRVDLLADLEKFLGSYTLTSLALAAAFGGRWDAESALLEHAKQVEAANRELEAFTYTIAHDLRAPLRALDGYADALKEDLGDDLSPDIEHSLNLIAANAGQMGKQIDALLNFSRLGTRVLKRQKLQPATIAQEVYARLAPSVSGRNVEFNLADLPPCSADPTLLISVFQNLLENALKFSSKRDVSKIDVGWLPQFGSPETTVYYVRDNGAGFEMEYSDRLFGVFARLHKQDQFPGTGAGLAIAKRIVARHGGRIWAWAELDRGATFFFTLPG
jgi:signal transduction histidine kinase